MTKPNASDYSDDIQFWADYRAWQLRQVMLANQRTERLRRFADGEVVRAAQLTSAERVALQGAAQ